jgi:hypothetical protein
MNEEQGLDELADAVFLLRTPTDAGVVDPGLVQSQKIGIKGHQYSLFSRGESQLVGIGQSTAPGVLCRDNVDAVSA